MNFLNEKTIAIGALTMIASIAMFIFQKESLNIIMVIVAGILALTNTVNNQK